MPTYTYPGVYIEELSSGVRTITGVATSITAFIGRAIKGPVNEATTITSYSDFERTFGGIAYDYPMSYAVRDFYQNGGTQAVIVRLFRPTFAVETDRQAMIDAANPLLTQLADYLDTQISGLSETEMQPFRAKVNGFSANAQEFAYAASQSAQAVWDSAMKAGPTAKEVKAAITAAVTAQKATTTDSTPYITTVCNGITTISDAIDDKKKAADVITAITPASAIRLDLSFQACVRLIKSLSNSATTAAAVTDGQHAVSTKKADAISSSATGFGRASKATISAADLSLEASSEGAWGNDLVVTIDSEVSQEIADCLGIPKSQLFNLSVKLGDSGPQEKFTNLSVANNVRNVIKILKQQSDLIRVPDGASPVIPTSMGTFNVNVMASDGQPLTLADYLGDDTTTPKIPPAFDALDDADLFNLLCIPPDDRSGDTDAAVYATAREYCAARRAMLIVDSPSGWSQADGSMSPDLKGNPRQTLGSLNLAANTARNAAIFFPRVVQADPDRGGQLYAFVPCGLIAGIFARTDATRGVWKAPAGLDASLNGIQSLATKLTDAENGLLNPIGLNCLRSFPASGNVVWGVRTLRGDDQLADEYKYIPVRRTALFIEESLYRGTKWAVFEPNDEPLSAQLRLNIGAFMHDLFRQGAFQGQTPTDAYFVKCNKETTTQTDINGGIVNVIVGFAPLKPAEFVVIKLTQIAGQIDV